MTPTSPDQVLDALQWRYATKQFDPTKKIPEDQWKVLEQSLVLTPSSFGLQPWEFIIVTDQEKREELVAHSWNQRQVADSSHLVVMALRTDVDDEWIDKFIGRIEEIRGEEGVFSGYRDMMVGFIANLDDGERRNWAKMQTYIALGQFMGMAAMMGIDTCPMEGFVAVGYDTVLGLTERNLSTAVLCPAGYRSDEDKYAHLPKVRFEHEEMVSHI